MSVEAMSNKSLNRAKVDINDEFFTLYEDIEKEVEHYIPYFENKIVYCNCDDYRLSNFFRYFVVNFDRLKLKRLYCSNFTNMKFVGSISDSYLVEINSVQGLSICENKFDIDHLFSIGGNFITKLYSGGDFRSIECLNVLQKSDIVCTNPPYSLLGDFYITLFKFNKKFLCVSNFNMLTYVGIYDKFCKNLFWNGYTDIKNFIDYKNTKLNGGGKFCMYKNYCNI